MSDAARYELPDPSLSGYDHGVGTLSVDGSIVGHLASVVLRMRFPAKQPWLWFVVVWLDGSREPKFEDYGPAWRVARELDSGHFEHPGPSKISERRLFGLPLRSVTPGPPVRFDFEWLPNEAARSKWHELGLRDADF